MTVYSTKKIMKESMPLLVPLILLGILAGQILDSREDFLIKWPIFLVMVPVINAVGGNIGSILGARLASGLHLGSINLNISDKELRKNVATALLLGIISYTTLTIFVLLVSPFLGIKTDINTLVKAGYIMIITGLLLTVIVIGISVFVARISFKKGLDPDNTITPTVTTLCDVLGIICLLAIIGAVGI